MLGDDSKADDGVLDDWFNENIQVFDESSSEHKSWLHRYVIHGLKDEMRGHLDGAVQCKEDLMQMEYNNYVYRKKMITTAMSLLLCFLIIFVSGVALGVFILKK